MSAWEMIVSLGVPAATILAGIFAAVTTIRGQRATKAVADRATVVEETRLVIQSWQEDHERLRDEVQALRDEVRALRVELADERAQGEALREENRALRSRERDRAEVLSALTGWARHVWHSATSDERIRWRPLPHEVYDLIHDQDGGVT